MTSLGARFLLSSLRAFWPDVIALSFIALALTMLCLGLIQIFGRYVLLGSLVLSTLVACVVTGVFWYSYAISGTPAPNQLQSDLTNTRLSMVRTYLEVYSISHIQYLLPICVLMTLVCIIIIVAVFAIRHNFYASLNYFDETGIQSVIGIPLILLQPFLTAIVVLAFLAYAVTTAVFIASSQDEVVDEDGFVTFVPHRVPSLWLLIILHVIGCLWVLEFLFACQDIVIASALSRWYFVYNHRKCLITAAPLFAANVALIRSGLGTAALGAAAINLAQLFRVATCRAVRHSGDSRVNLNNKTQPPGCDCCDGNFAHFSTRSALVCHAVFGGNFHISGKRAYVLQQGYNQQLSALASFSALGLFLCKLAVVLITLLAALMWLHERNGFYPIVECLFPILIICIVAYVIAACFLNVYVIAFETIFLCYCIEDYLKRPDVSIAEKESIVSTLTYSFSTAVSELSPVSFHTAQENVEPSAHTFASSEKSPETFESPIFTVKSPPKIVKAPSPPSLKLPPPPPPQPPHPPAPPPPPLPPKPKIVKVPVYVEVPVPSKKPKAPRLPELHVVHKTKSCVPYCKFPNCPGINAKTIPRRPGILGNLIETFLPTPTVCEPFPQLCRPRLPCEPNPVYEASPACRPRKACAACPPGETCIPHKSCAPCHPCELRTSCKPCTISAQNEPSPPPCTPCESCPPPCTPCVPCSHFAPCTKDGFQQRNRPKGSNHPSNPCDYYWLRDLQRRNKSSSSNGSSSSTASSPRQNARSLSQNRLTGSARYFNVRPSFNAVCSPQVKPKNYRVSHRSKNQARNIAERHRISIASPPVESIYSESVTSQ